MRTMRSIRRRTLAPWLAWLVAAATLVAPAAFAVEVVTRPTPVAETDMPQQRPRVSTLADGRFVVVLEDGSSDSGILDPPQSTDGRDGSREGIIGRLFDRLGAPAGEPFVVNTTTDGPQVCPRVAADPTTGGFVVAWIDSPRGDEIVLRRFAADGQPSTGEIRVPQVGFTMYCGVGLAVATDGTIVVTSRHYAEPLAVFHIGADDVPVERASVQPLPALVGAESELLATADGGAIVADRVTFGVPHDPSVVVARLGADGELVENETTFATAASMSATLRPHPGAPGQQELAIATAENLEATIYRFDADQVGDAPQTTPIPPARADWVALTSYGDDLVLVAGKEGNAQGPVSGAGQLSIHRLGPNAEPVDDIAYLRVDHGSRWLAPLAASANADGRLLVAFEEESFLGQVAMAVFEIEPPSLFLTGDRFAVSVEWLDFDGQTGDGLPVPLSADTGAFWFFEPTNLELTVKVLDGRALNGHFWVFQGSLTNVGYVLTVTDRVTGAVYTFTNPLGQFASFGDIEALPGP